MLTGLRDSRHLRRYINGKVGTIMVSNPRQRWHDEDEIKEELNSNRKLTQEIIISLINENQLSGYGQKSIKSFRLYRNLIN